MQFDFSRNYFELFDLPASFEVDQSQIEQKYRDLQSAWHPDRYADADDGARRLAVQTTSFINEAYQVLRDEQTRARYLLQLKGVEFDEDKDTTQDMEFLMSQMQLREQIDEAEQHEDPLARVDQLEVDAKDHYLQLQDQFVECFTGEEWEQAKETVLKMQFFKRLRQQIAQKQEQLEEQLL